MQIYGPFRISTSQATGAAQRIQPQSPGNAAMRSAGPVDQLDLSSSVAKADRASSVAGGGEIRIDRVADLRRQIASGNYDTPERLDSALERMLDRLG